MRRSRSSLLLASQGMAAVVALGLLASWPPERGRLLLVPIGADTANPMAVAAVAAGATLLGMGPLPGSLIVMGDRAGIARRMMPWHVAILAAPPAACGGGVA